MDGNKKTLRVKYSEVAMCGSPARFYATRPAALPLVLFISTALMIVSATYAVALVSDDFNTASLDTSIWTFVNPLGDGSAVTTGAGSGQGRLQLSVPAGVAHDSWTDGNFMPRVMQAVTNTDFEVEVKFDAATTQTYQMQGLIVEQDANTWLRSEFYRTGGQVKLYVALIQQGGSVTTYTNSSVPTGAPIWMQLQRQGHQWTVRYSTDGQSFTTGVSFTRTLTVSALGIVVGNYAVSGNAPAFTALVDYFFDTANPIVSENSANMPPVANAGPDQWVTDTNNSGSEDVVLDGSGSSDPDGTIMSYEWYRGTDLIATGVNPTVSLAVGTHMIRLVVTDNDSATGADTVTISVVEPSALVSDDFNTPSLDTSIWTFVNPLGDGSAVTTGAGSGQARLQLSVPAGVSHDSWTDGNFMPRVMQAVTNTDFEVEVKFDAATTQSYQMQGLIVEQDANTWLRSEFYRTGGLVKLYVALIQQGGAVTTYTNSSVPTGAPIWMQLHRQGHQWTVRYSADGQSFTTGVSFTRTLTVSALGIVVGNYAVSGNAPAFTALVDYFFDTANPIIPEDGVPSSPPTIDVWYGNNQIFGQIGTPQEWVNVLGNVTAPDGVASLTYQLNGGAQQSVALHSSAHHVQHEAEGEEVSRGALRDNDSRPYRLSDAELVRDEKEKKEGEQQEPPYRMSDAELVLDEKEQEERKRKEKEKQEPPRIGPDYRLSPEQREALDKEEPPRGPDYRLSPEQQGALNRQGLSGRLASRLRKEPREILKGAQFPSVAARRGANVQATAASAEVQLSMGPDSRRLQDQGDFNADIRLEDLHPGLNQIVFTAVDNLGHKATKTITFDYDDTNVWPLPYAINWSQIGHIQDVAQVVDGFWELEGNGVRSVLPGYDRLIAIGDLLWDDYEVTAVITMHDLDPRGYLPPSHAPAIGLGLRWSGHRVISSAQPAVGVVNQYGSLGVYRFRTSGCGPRLELYRDDFTFVPEPTCTELEFGVPYIFKMRAETQPGGQFYALKVWEQGQTEPSGWHLTLLHTASSAPRSGSILLLSHHVDATFSNISISPLP